MKLTLQTDEEFSSVHVLFASELKRRHERSTVTLENVGGKAVFIVIAQDVSALRASLNSITSILGVFQKTKEVLK